MPRAAKSTVEAGHQALKLDPFLEMQPYHTGYLSRPDFSRR